MEDNVLPALASPARTGRDLEHLSGLIRDRRLRDELIPLHEVPALIPSTRPGKRIALATVYRWANRGRLPTLKIGGGRFVSATALAEFIGSPVKAPIDAVETRTAAQAGSELDRLLSRSSRKLPARRRDVAASS